MSTRLLVVLVLLGGCQWGPDPLALYWKHWSDEKLHQWQESSRQLVDASSGYCADDLALPALQEQLQHSFLRWSELNGFPYKGVSDLALEFELYFWPDRRNRVAGQLQRRINDEETATVTSLETRIAAEKGLAALEWLVFTEGLEPQSRCRLLPAVATDYATKVDAVAQYHQTNPVIQAAFMEPGAEQQSNSIALNLLFAQVTALESRLIGSLNDNMEWLQLEAWGSRSNSTLASFAASTQVLLNHLDYMGNRPELAEDTLAELQHLIADGERLAARLDAGESAIADELLSWLSAVEAWLQSLASRDLNVLIGFNNFDGD